MNKEESIKRIKDRVMDQVHIPIEKITVSPAIVDFINCAVYYVDYVDSDPDVDKSDCFFYALINEKGDAILYDDGIQAIERLKAEMDKRRGFWLRINEFSLIEVIAGFIAICVTFVFIYLSLQKEAVLPKEFIGIFGIIVGYYFGKNMTTR